MSRHKPICLQQYSAQPIHTPPPPTGPLQVIIHLFGDVPSPILLGYYQGFVQDFRYSMGSVTTLLLLGSLVFGLGLIISPGEPDYREIAPNPPDEHALEPTFSYRLSGDGSAPPVVP